MIFFWQNSILCEQFNRLDDYLNFLFAAVMFINYRVSPMRFGSKNINISLYLLMAANGFIIFLLYYTLQRNTSSILTVIIEQRNTISQQLNTAMREVAKLQCESNMNGSVKVAAGGGWCHEPAKHNGSQHMFDQGAADGIADIVANCNIASFGDGPGTYKKYIDATGKATCMQVEVGFLG